MTTEIDIQHLGFALRHAWLVPAFPLVSFVLVGLFLRPLSGRISGIVATLAVFCSWVAACAVAREYYTLCPPGGVPFAAHDQQDAAERHRPEAGQPER